MVQPVRRMQAAAITAARFGRGDEIIENFVKLVRAGDRSLEE
jgi:hypothetical protein